MVEYTYDPWGACTIVSDSTTFSLSTLNPFRYRGYYYDEETGFYYLQSRYYDPATCKFINADDPSILLVDPYNIQSIYNYDYCNFNPVNNVDPSGYWVMSLGFEIKAACVFGLSWAFSFNLDSKGNFSITMSAGVLIAFNIYATIGIYTAYYGGYNNVSNIKGWAFSTGVDLAFGLYFGAGGSFEISSGKTTPVANYSLGGGASVVQIPTLFVKASKTYELLNIKLNSLIKKGKTVTKSKLGLSFKIKPYTSYVRITNNRSKEKIYVYKSGKMVIRK